MTALPEWMLTAVEKEISSIINRYEQEDRQGGYGIVEMRERERKRNQEIVSVAVEWWRKENE